MKIRIKEHTLTALNNLKGLWLLRQGSIIIIKSFQYTQEKPEDDPEPEVNTSIFKRKKFRKKDMSIRTYVTDMVVAGYQTDLKFVGTYNDEYCEDLINKHNDSYYNLNLISCRKAWTDIIEQKDAFLEYEENEKTINK